MPSEYLTDDDIIYLIAITREAGRIAIDKRSNITVKAKCDPLDLVTEADLAISDMLVSALKSRFPSDAVVSEEAPIESVVTNRQRYWFLDPIDGTENYVANDGQYSVMLGLVVNDVPVFAFIGAPSLDTVFFGGHGYGAWKKTGDEQTIPLCCPPERKKNTPVRLMMGTRCRRAHSWVENLTDIEWIHSGSVGLRVARIIEKQADAYLHLSGKLKLWDTAGPIALARAAGLEISTLGDQLLTYSTTSLVQTNPLIIGVGGTIAWSQQKILPLLTKLNR